MNCISEVQDVQCMYSGRKLLENDLRHDEKFA